MVCVSAGPAGIRTPVACRQCSQLHPLALTQADSGERAAPVTPHGHPEPMEMDSPGATAAATGSPFG